MTNNSRVWSVHEPRCLCPQVVTAKMASYEKRGQLLDLQEAYVRRGVAREQEND